MELPEKRCSHEVCTCVKYAESRLYFDVTFAYIKCGIIMIDMYPSVTKVLQLTCKVYIDGEAAYTTAVW